MVDRERIPLSCRGTATNKVHAVGFGGCWKLKEGLVEGMGDMLRPSHMLLRAFGIYHERDQVTIPQLLLSSSS